MRPALEHVCRKQTLRASLRKWFLRANLPYVSSIKVQRSLRCSSVHFLGICVMRTAAQCQILIFCRRKIFFFGSRHYAAVLLTKVPKSAQTYLLVSSIFHILETYGKFARKTHFLALGVCFPQPCSSAGRRFAASGSRIASFPQRRIRWNAL